MLFRSPQWVTDKADEVISSMRRSSQLASQVEKAVLNWLEALVLQPWVGHNFEAVVLSADQEKNKASAFLTQPRVKRQNVCPESLIFML